MPPIKKPVQKLLASEMNRREFLGFLGAAALSVIGVTSILRGLDGAANHEAKSAYGSSPYGGNRESRPARRL